MMKNMSAMKKIVTATLLAVATLSLSAQKKPLDHSVYDAWQSVGATTLSAQGDVIAYEVNPQEGDGVLYLKVFGKKGREMEIPRGYRVRILDNSRYAVCLIKPQFQKTRRARIDKKKADDMPKDSLAVINLTSGEVRKFPDVKGYKMGKYALDAFAFSTADTSFVPKKERKKKDIGGPVAVYHFASGTLDTLRHIGQYAFSKDGRQLALIRKNSKFSTEAGLYSVSTRSTTFLADTTAWHGVPQFNEEGTAFLFTAAPDTLDSGSKHASLFQYTLADGRLNKLAGPEADGIPQGWGITENSDCRYSHDGKHIFVGLQERVPPKDTSLVPFETAGLDLWTWNAPEIPPAQKVNLKRDAARTYPAQVLSNGSLKLLNDNKFSRLYQGDRGDAPYNLLVLADHPVELQWNYQNHVSLLLQSPEGEREIASGNLGRVTLSPLARYVLWWDYATLSWNSYSIADGATRQLVQGLGVNFWDETDDHPMRQDPYGTAGWVEGDSALLLYDRYDLWKVPTDGSAPIRITAGREKGITYRYLNLKDREEQRHVGVDETLFLSLFDNASKENGLATVQLSRPEKTFKTLVRGGYSWSGLQKARLAPVYSYQKGNFRDPMDVYYSAAIGQKEQKLSAINPQIGDYNWGSVELYHWNAYDGTALDGLLYKPEDFDAAKRYPVMIYFYEKNSDHLYSHYSVAPSRSIINIPFYVSRGYIVFVPDIVYMRGLPGQSAYNCIVSGAESLTRFPWIDKDNMAIQGQSWGGYQVAQLITRTGMFKAAGAGAPVSNMTSAYGGIRWESGSSRQGQYEMGQSRIGRDLWNATELYMENSPLFRLPEVTTPVLIMHNDADGAVPWYQGIEMFMGLRRLGKAAWLLEYNDEAHNLRERRNCKDLSIRLQQFFDHYLKGAPEPAWMRDGIPTAKKGYYFGFEDAR